MRCTRIRWTSYKITHQYQLLFYESVIILNYVWCKKFFKYVEIKDYYYLNLKIEKRKEFFSSVYYYQSIDKGR